MTSFMDQPSDALRELQDRRNVTEDLLNYTQSTRGRPSNQQTSLYLAAMLFIYATWEQYVETLAVEVVSKMAHTISPQRLPGSVKKSLRSHDGWALAVEPGWQALWMTSVRDRAVGDPSNPSGAWGMNTASYDNVGTLFGLLGISDPIPKRLHVGNVPPEMKIHVKKPSGETDTRRLLDLLIGVRGEVAHTGQLEESLRKNHVEWWHDTMRRLCEATDKQVRAAARSLVEG